MANSKITTTTNKIRELIPGDTIHVEIGCGMEYMVNILSGIGTKPFLSVRYTIVGITTALIHIGIIKIGFQAIGVPNTNGSLILKMEGINAAREIAFNFWDFALALTG